MSMSKYASKDEYYLSRIRMLRAENEALAAFREAVVGWRECDHPEGFDKRTAEFVCELGRMAGTEAKERQAMEIEQ